MRVTATFLLLILTHNFSYAEPINSADIKVNAFGRVRGEANNNHDFSNALEDKNNFIGSRFKLSLDFAANPKTQIFMQYQYSKRWGLPSGTLQDDPSSVHQAFIKYKLFEALSFKIGRQELSYGDELLIGAVGWSNIGRSFDAFKARWTYSNGWTDVFIADVSKSTGTNMTNDHYFSGLYNHFTFTGLDNLDIYALHSQDPSGSLANDAIHYGVRVKSKAESFDYRTEITGQAEVDGHQWDAELGYSLNRSRFSLEFFSASKNFIQLFPTAHKWLGTGDFFSRRNISGLRVGTSHNFTDRLKSTIDYHVFQRTDNQSPTYAFNGSAATAAGQNKHTGDEVDVNLAFQVDENFSVSVNGAHFFAGEHLKENGLNSDGDSYYLQTTARF